MNNENHKNEAKIFTFKRKIAYNEKKPCKVKISAFDTNDPLNLHTLFEDLKRSDLSDDIILAGIIRAKQVLYRDIRNLNPTGPEFCQSDDTVFRNKVSTNINIFSKILEFLTLKCTSSRTIFVCFNDESLPNLFSLLKSEDEIERKNVCQTLKNIFDKKILCNEITRLLENEFQLFNVGSRTHIGMDLILNLFYYTFTVTKSISFCSFVENILFFIKKAQIEYFDDFKKIVLGFCTGNLKKSKFTLNFIYHHFEDVTYLRRVVLVEIIVDLFIFWKGQLKESVIGLTDLINSALSSGHHLLLEEVIGFFEHKEIYDLIKEQVDEFLPLIFDKLYEISKKYWRRKGKAKVFKNIALILNMSHCVFEKCLIDYNRRRYGENEIKNEVIKNEVIEVVEKCLEKCCEYSELEKQNEEKYNKRMGM